MFKVREPVVAPSPCSPRAAVCENEKTATALQCAFDPESSCKLPTRGTRASRYFFSGARAFSAAAFSAARARFNGRNSS